MFLVIFELIRRVDLHDGPRLGRTRRGHGHRHLIRIVVLLLDAVRVELLHPGWLLVHRQRALLELLRIKFLTGTSTFVEVASGQVRLLRPQRWREQLLLLCLLD